MIREEKMIAAIEVFFNEKLDTVVSEILKLFETRYASILAGFREKLAVCAARTKALQKEGKGPVRFVVISVLLSSTITKSYHVRLEFLGEEMHLDEYEASAYWTPEFMLPFFEAADEDTVHKLWARRVIGIEERELLEYKYGYVGALMRLYPRFCKKLAEDSFDLLAEVNTAEEVFVLFGNYMEKAPCIATYRAF